VLNDPNLLRDHVELLAGFDADLNECVAIVGAEALRLGKFMPDDLARQRWIERLATALFTRMGGYRRCRNVLLRGLAASARQRFCFVERAELAGFACLARCTEQLTLVLVDDDLDNLWALQVVLESGGHHVLLAQNGVQALCKIRQELPRLIVTDWQMPEMDGAELCRRVRCQPAFAHLPIVMLSAMAEPASDPRCQSAFFRKPADLVELLRTVDLFVAVRLTGCVKPSLAEERAPFRWQPVDDRCWP
jgi:CheY-like chemotaxis protein